MPTRGIERWLTQRLSAHLGASPGGHDGVCANIDFPFPGTLVNGALARAAGTDPEADPWLPATGGLAADGGGRGALRRAVARTAGPAHAQLGDRGGVEALLEHPPRGRPLRPLRRAPARHAAAVGRTGSAEDDEAGVAGRAVAPAAGPHRTVPARPSACSKRAGGSATSRSCSTCPPRLSLFGLTRLPASYLDVLEAMAARPRRAPLPAASVAGAVGPAGGRRRDRRRAPCSAAEDPTAGAPHNPLLASWGRDAREMQLVLGGGRHPRGDRRHAAPAAGPRDAAAADPGRRPGRPRPARRPTARGGATAARCWRRTTTASACTRATAGAARWRCSATPSSTCSRTTRRSSRGTSSSCAPTSRPSRR